MKQKKKVLVSGSGGLVGGLLVPALAHAGCVTSRMVRRPVSERSRNVSWDPEKGFSDPKRLEGFQAVVHLAGENIAGRRWTARQKRRIFDSRVKGTRLLCEALASAPRRPQVLVCASAIGYYGDRGEEVLTEDSEPGRGFLSKVCQEWEAATEAARDAGIRVIHLRLGLVLTTQGGALPKILPLFKLGMGGVLGNGRQYMSWVGVQDVVRAILYLLAKPDAAGVYNVTSPGPVTNREFTRTLARVMHRPAILPVPGLAISLAMGQMGRELLLTSARVHPERLLNEGFTFRFTELEHALGILIPNGL